MRRGGGDAILNNLYHLFGNLRLIEMKTINFHRPRPLNGVGPNDWDICERFKEGKATHSISDQVLIAY